MRTHVPHYRCAVAHDRTRQCCRTAAYVCTVGAPQPYARNVCSSAVPCTLDVRCAPCACDASSPIVCWGVSASTLVLAPHVPSGAPPFSVLALSFSLKVKEINPYTLSLLCNSELRARVTLVCYLCARDRRPNDRRTRSHSRPRSTPMTSKTVVYQPTATIQ